MKRSLSWIIVVVIIAVLAGCMNQAKNPYEYGSPQWFAWEQQRREAKEDLQRSLDKFDRSVQEYGRPPQPIYPLYPPYPTYPPR